MRKVNKCEDAFLATKYLLIGMRTTQLVTWLFLFHLRKLPD